MEKQRPVKMILFDLDGTLLPMDMDTFTKGYFMLLAKKLQPHGYTDPQKLIDAVWTGTAAMVKNDGSCTNDEAFWRKFSSIYGEECLRDIPLFEEFYAGDFQKAKEFCGFNAESERLVQDLKKAGMRVALATNPLFPAIATESRIRWAGLSPEDFEYYTTYENACFCKPNPAYYTELTEKLHIDPSECFMAGNDAEEDMIAETVGMKVFLLTDCLINKKNRDISAYPQGGFKELRTCLREEYGIDLPD